MTMFCPECGHSLFHLYGTQEVHAPLGDFTIARGEVRAGEPLKWRPTPKKVEQEFLLCQECGEEWEPDQLLDSPPTSTTRTRDDEIDEMVADVVAAFPSWREAEEEDEYSGVLSDEEKDAHALERAISRIVFGGKRMKQEVERRARERLDLQSDDATESG